MVLASVNVPRPSYSVILFFFIRKCTPLTRPSATLRLRSKAAPKSKLTLAARCRTSSPRCVKMCASSALRSSALEGMQPTFRQTPPQYFSSMMAVLKPELGRADRSDVPTGTRAEDNDVIV